MTASWLHAHVLRAWDMYQLIKKYIQRLKAIICELLHVDFLLYTADGVGQLGARDYQLGAF